MTTRFDESRLRARQLQRELDAVNHSMEVAEQRIQNQLLKGRVDSLPYKNAILSRMIKSTDKVLNDILEKPNRGLSVIYSKELIKEVNQTIDLSTLICDFLLAELAKEPKTVTVIGSQLGRRIVRAYQMALFIKTNKYYYEEMKRFLDRGRVGSFDNIYERFIAAKRVNVDSLKFDKSAIEAFGSALLNKILVTEDSYLTSYLDYKTSTKTYKFLCFTPEIYARMSEIVEHCIDNSFDRIPCVATPRPWHKINGKYVGGFYSKYMADATTIQLGDRDRKIPEIPQPYLDALNKLQSTGYTVNQNVYNFVKKAYVDNLEIADLPRASNLDLTDIPKGIDEVLEKELRTERRNQHKENVKIFSKGIALHMALKQCEELKNDVFYFVHSLDYRGRLYCMSNGLTTQGADYIKGLIQFDEAREVGERGLYWLKIRAANTWKYDKESLDDRAKIITQYMEDGTFDKIASDPIGTWSLWSDADKPVQFLATVFELATAQRLRDPSKHMSRLAVGLDGACNGSQHLAVLSGDNVLATSVNVLPSSTFKDIYQAVIDKVWADMFTPDVYKELSDKGYTPEEIRVTLNWLFTTYTKPPRNLVKRCVMTLPYGSTVRGRMDFIRDFVNKEIKNDIHTASHCMIRNKMVAIIAYMVDRSLMSTTGGAIQSMEFLQDVARQSVIDTGTFKYTTPLGLEVDNFIPTMKRRSIRFMNYVVTQNEKTTKPNLMKIKACSAPNYIHSMDACHLVMVVNDDSCSHLLAVHDDIGTYPSDTQKLYDTIRDKFVTLYKGKDYFNEINPEYKTFEKLGEVDIDLVRKSDFFFS